jgi:outer membrane immunogenic protein
MVLVNGQRLMRREVSIGVALSIHKEDFMRRKFVLGIGLFAFAAAGAGSATAADIAARPGAPSSPPPPPAFISDWAGFYIGINGGGGFGHTSYQPFGQIPQGEGQEILENGTIIESETTNNLGFVPPNQSLSGGIFGFQAGHNWQWGPVVGGLELDFDGANIKGSSTSFAEESTDIFTQQAKIDELASARARLGYLIFPNWLLYGTVGLGWGHFRLDATDTVQSAGGPEFASTTNFANEFGWVVGAGLEWKFVDHWLLRGEWLHYDFGNQTIFGAVVVPGAEPGIFNARTTVDVARAALSYKF